MRIAQSLIARKADMKVWSTTLLLFSVGASEARKATKIP